MLIGPSRVTTGGRSLLALALPLALAFLPEPSNAQAFDASSGPATGVPVDSVLVEGNRIFQTAPLLGTIGVFAGDSVGYLEVQEAERRLWATGSFRDVSVTVRESPTGGAVLTFHIEEHPIIRSRQVEGLENLNESEVWEEIGLTQGAPYKPDLFVRARRFIQDELAERGIPFAQVEEVLTPMEDDPTSTRWLLRVTEGQRVTVAEVGFNGNEVFEDSELAGRMSSREEGFFWFRSGALSREVLQEDLDVRLPEFYASQGFLDFQVLGDTVVIDPATGKARLEIDVAEGPRYRVGSFEIEGNRLFLTEDLEDYYQPNESGLLSSLGFGGGQTDELPVFDQSAFQDATFRVQELYGNQGYMYAGIVPEIERIPAESSDEDPRVALRWVIEEGQPAYVRRVNIVGNDYTHDRVIREKIFLLPGDVFSRDRLIQSYQSISGLGFFESPLPEPLIDADPQTGDIDITFQVQERSTGSMTFGTTVGGATGLSGFIGYDQPNLFGQAKFGSVRWDFGRYRNSFSLQYSDPALFQSRVSGSISLFNAQDRFFTFSTGDRRVVGVSTQIGVPVPGSLFSRLFFGYSISRTSYDLEGGVTDTSLFGRPSGVQSQFSLGVARSTLDHPLFPTVGSEQRWTTEINGGLLGGDGDFTKHLVEGQWWVPVGSIGGDDATSQPIRLALGFRARGGIIAGDPEAFPFERFWLGGVQFGESLRGYEETTITPIGYVERGDRSVQDIQRLGDAFMVIGAEYALRLSGSISLSAFYEAGNVWTHRSEVDPSKLFRGAGIGLQLVTPFGPFGLDYAYGFDRIDPGWQLHFRLGGQQGL